MDLTVLPGIDILMKSRLDLVRGQRVGIVTNHTGTNRDLRATVDLLVSEPGVTVTALFGPEHGIRGDVSAGEHVGGSTDPRTGLPVHSLYGETRKPTPEMLTGVDVLVFDMQDAGVRFYTYTWTMALCLQAAAEQGRRMVVLDRPDPISGAIVEGGVVHPGFASFVGLYPVATRHGMTLGEIALWLSGTFRLGCDLHVVPMQGWRRSMWWEETRLPFVPMSPNANSMEMLALYPGTCFFEATNLSEGRGTALPLQIFGAPWLNEQAVIAELQSRRLPGVLFRPTYFTPLASKHQGELCRGVQIHVTDRRALRPVALGAHLLDVCRRLHPGEFALRPAALGVVRPLDRLTGSGRLAQVLESGEPVAGVLAEWEQEAAAFTEAARAYYLYG
ncbi:MAG TPA: DUF1343 domain-containing protein [Symbiobacteriaceae bacterium]|nr:DUF1343 domain-containing protein [Symbiobacteriaceae bacterium]